MSYTVIIPPDDPTPDPADRTLIAPDKIAADLMAAIQGNPALNAAYTVTRTGSTLVLTKTAGTASVTASDTLQGDGLKIITGNTVASYEDLPAECPTGTRLRIAGNPESSTDDAWVAFDGAQWAECAAPNVQVELNPYQMPWVLSAGGTPGARTFAFGPVAWSKRAAGDNTNNPAPTLDSIDTLFVVQGRLGITSGADIVLSAVGDPLRLFRKSVRQLLADDPVAVRSALGTESSYHTALDWDSDTHLWSRSAQVRISGSPAITPTTIALDVVSRFDNDPTVPPVVVGNRVYYTRHVGGCTRVYEYTRPPGFDTLPASTEITEHVPTYLAGQATFLTADDAHVVVNTGNAGGTLYVCHLHPSQNGPVPAWHTWTFSGATIEQASFAHGSLLLATRRSGTARLETIDAANPATGTPQDLGTISVVPQVTLKGFYVRSEKGPETTGRFVVRHLTVHHTGTVGGTMTLADETTPRVTIPTQSASSVPLRVPILRAAGDDFGLVFSWYGNLTGLDVEGTYINRRRAI